MKVGDLVEACEFGVGIITEIVIDYYRVFYPGGKWYLHTESDLEVISEGR